VYSISRRVVVWTYESLVSELRINCRWVISFTSAIDASWLGSWLYRSASLKATSNRNGTLVYKFLGYSLYSCLRAPPGEIFTCRVMPLSLACVSSLTSAAARKIVIRNDMLGRTDCCLSPISVLLLRKHCALSTLLSVTLAVHFKSPQTLWWISTTVAAFTRWSWITPYTATFDCFW